MRRIWLGLVIYGLVLGATANAQATRTHIDALGREVSIPEQPQRIVAIRHDALATPLLELGAPVVGTTGATHAETGEVFIRGAGDLLGIEFGEDSGITNIGSGGGVDLEIVTELDPDLIIAWNQDQLEQFEIIAPTVVVPTGLLFLDHIELLADLAGVSDTYEHKVATYRSLIDEIQETLGDPSSISVSRPQMYADGIWYYQNWGAIDQVIEDIGFGQPDILATRTEPWAKFSVESLQDFDTDILLMGHAAHMGNTPEFFIDEWDAGLPFWRNLTAVQEGNFFWYPRDTWHGYTFKSLDIAANSLYLLTAGRFHNEN